MPYHLGRETMNIGSFDLDHRQRDLNRKRCWSNNQFTVYSLIRVWFQLLDNHLCLLWHCSFESGGWRQTPWQECPSILGLEWRLKIALCWSRRQKKATSGQHTVAANLAPWASLETRPRQICSRARPRPQNWLHVKWILNEQHALEI